jgi:RND family efflux transporter MFP subunit
MKLSAHIVGTVGLLSVWSVVGCGSKGEAPPAQARPVGPARSVKVVRVETRGMERVLQVVGTLSAHEEATVAAQVAGQIERAYLDVGDRARAGQRMASIDTSAYHALVRQAEANLARAQARADNVGQTLRRVQELEKNRFAPASELDQAVAEAAAAQAEVKSAQAAAAIARLNLERSQVKAPFDGAVAERIASSGDYVAVGAPMFRLVQVDPLRLRLQVPERESTPVRVGQPVRVTVEGDSERHVGKVARIAPAIRESDRVLQVEADIPNQGGLRAGLFARAEIVISDRDQALSVPPRALLTFAGLEKIVLVKAGKALEKTVVTGRRGDGWVEIVSGLSAGDVVALEPAGLRTGQPVKTVEATVPPGGAGTGGDGSI